MADRTPVMEALGEIERVLDRLSPAMVARGERLACAQRARGLASRLSAVAAVLLAEADAANESLRESGTPTSSWLAVRGGLSKREAAGLLHQARSLAEHPGVADAAAAGRISVGQARAIGTVLHRLDGLDEGQQAEAEQVLLELAGRLDTDQLTKAAPQVLTEVAPGTAQELVETRLQREAEAAHRNRSLRFFRDGGSVRFDGSLPRVEAEEWMCLLDAWAESQRRTAVEERDPLVTPLTPEQRRADALIGMVRAHRTQREAPRSGVERPRVVVTVSYTDLLTRAAGAGLIAGDQPISAGELRRLCCDAGLLPAVLGGPSQVLDVGREHRLVTPAIRSALVLRDGGCVFPGFQTRPSACEAHHVIPWWAGGPTSTANLALLCHHHHALMEPARYTIRDQWEVRIATDGIPETIPPRRFDPDRRPIRHARHEPGRARGHPPRVPQPAPAA